MSITGLKWCLEEKVTLCRSMAPQGKWQAKGTFDGSIKDRSEQVQPIREFIQVYDDDVSGIQPREWTPGKISVRVLKAIDRVNDTPHKRKEVKPEKMGCPCAIKNGFQYKHSTYCFFFSYMKKYFTLYGMLIALVTWPDLNKSFYIFQRFFFVLILQTYNKMFQLKYRKAMA